MLFRSADGFEPAFAEGRAMPGAPPTTGLLLGDFNDVDDLEAEAGLLVAHRKQRPLPSSGSPQSLHSGTGRPASSSSSSSSSNADEDRTGFTTGLGAGTARGPTVGLEPATGAFVGEVGAFGRAGAAFALGDGVGLEAGATDHCSAFFLASG